MEISVRLGKFGGKSNDKEFYRFKRNLLLLLSKTSRNELSTGIIVAAIRRSGINRERSESGERLVDQSLWNFGNTNETVISYWQVSRPPETVRGIAR